MQRQITTEQIVETALESHRASMYFRLPGVVVAYYPTTQTADVQPMTNDPRTNLDTDAVETEPWPVLLQVRVAWPKFGGPTGGFIFCGPLKVGDPVILEAFDLDPTTAFKAGRSTTPVDPSDVHRHGGGYWSCTPADLTAVAASAAAAATAFLLGIDGDQAQVQFSPGSIQLGATGGDFMALASKVDACMAVIKTHTHPVTVTGVTPGTGAGVAASTASAALSSLPATGSALVKAQ